MKILSLKPKQGYARILVNTLDDLWHLSKIIEKNDLVSAKTTRKIKLGKEGERQKSKKRDIFIKIKVEKVFFDSGTLRIRGSIESGPEDVTLHSTHTLGIDVGTEFKLEKKKWYAYQISRLKEAEELSVTPKAIVCVLDDEEASFGTLTPSGIKSLGRFSLRLSKKRLKERRKPDDIKRVAQEIIRLAKNNWIEKAIIGSPIIWKEQVHRELQSRAPKLAKNTYLETVSTGSKRGFHELVASGAISKIMKKSSAVKEEKLIEKLLKEISKDSGLYAYGLHEVHAAANLKCIEQLLISEKLLDKEKKNWVSIKEVIELCEKHKSKIHVIDSSSEAGKKLLSLGGIAALLNYKIS